LDCLIKKVASQEWARVDVRDFTREILLREVYKREGWVWDGIGKKAAKRTILISRTFADVPEVKYRYGNKDAIPFYAI
jgi:hypothetical protein